MTRFVKDHEIYMDKMIKSAKNNELKQLGDYHLIQIEFLQHERLIHLLVTLAFALFLIIALIVTWLFPVVLLFILDMILMVVNLFYIIHYYRLENTVQRWYGLYNLICEMAEVDV